MAYAQFAASSQFYLYGKSHFTQTGYIKHAKTFKPFDLEGVNLEGKVYMVTGAASGIGREITAYLARRGATVHMVCRSPKKAEAVRDAIVKESGNEKVYVLVMDCSLESSVRSGWSQFENLGLTDEPRLDGLVCNAGVLLNTKQLTSEGVETTFACHLLFGAYLLGSLALPWLLRSQGRLVLMASGGMYNTKYPGHDTAASLVGKYDGNLVYAFAKRGQVLLAERWAKEFPEVVVVTSHPGWALTDAVDEAYGEQKKYLEPFRTPWEGAEGTCWLLAVPRPEIESGAFYLDRRPQVKHMAGPFFSEGSFTKNTPEEVEAMMQQLAKWSDASTRPSEQTLQAYQTAAEMVGHVSKAEKIAPPQEGAIDIQRFMGKWYVIAHIPTVLDKGSANNTEEYTWNAEKGVVDVVFTYSKRDLSSTKQVMQTGFPDANGTVWKLSLNVPLLSALTLPYVLHHVDEAYSTCIVGSSSRSFLYIMARTPELSETAVADLKTRSMQLGYAMDQCVLVPQTWDKNGDYPKGSAGPKS